MNTINEETIYNEEVLESMAEVVIYSLGGRKDDDLIDKHGLDRIRFIIDSSSQSKFIVGCKFYPTSLNQDKTVDESQKTVVMTTYLNPKYITQVQNSKEVLVSKQFREYFSKYLEGLGFKHKLLIFQNINKNDPKNNHVPDFVTKHHILVKIIFKIPNQ